MNSAASSPPRPVARAGITSTSPLPRLRLSAWFGPFNPGREPGPPGEKHTDYTGRDIPEGGTAIPYWMEDPFIREEYETRLKAEGVENRMRPEYYDKNYKGPLPTE